MSPHHREPESATLPPFPEGWYFIASRQTIEDEGLLQKTWMGERIIAWCDGDGRVCVAEAICPHLGSDLGPEAGGRIRAGELVCPFHGFMFDTSGQCVATPFAAPPRSAKLHVFETQEVCGLIFAWWGVGGREPQWRLPDPAGDGAAWSTLRSTTLRFPGHPQETTENAVDLAHLRYTHGYTNVEHTRPATVDGPLLETQFDFRRTRKTARMATLSFDVSASVSALGVGYSFVEGHERSMGMDFQMWVLVTPVDGTLVDLTLVSRVRRLEKPRRLFVGLRFLPTGLRAPLINRFLLNQQRDDVLQDIVIWSRKRYVSRPVLCRSDGEITTYREHCAQFYPTAAPAEAPVARTAAVDGL